MAFTPQDDINILQASDNAVVGAGAGDDTYILAPETLAPGQSIILTDTQGVNRLQLLDGLAISSSRVAHDALLLTLSNGAEIKVLDASAHFQFSVGGTVNSPTPAQDFATFVNNSLGVRPPARTEEPIAGGALVIGSDVLEPEPEPEPPEIIPTGTPQPSANEVLMLELINRARLDPLAEAERFDITLNQGLPAETIAPTPTMPLAMNTQLIEAARSHSDWMLQSNTFSHTGAGESTAFERMEDAGYRFSAAGENIAWSGTTGELDLTEAIEAHHAGLFRSPGHRTNILNSTFSEVGIGQREGTFAEETLYNASMLTQNFGRALEINETVFITGVLYEDVDANGFYGVNEGLSGVLIEFEQHLYETFDAGAYTLPVPAGIHELIFHHDAFEVPIVHQLEVADANIKLDLIGKGDAGFGVEVSEWL